MEWLQTIWETSLQWVRAIDAGGIGTWTLTVSLMVAGLLGTVLPLLPGPLLIFLAGLFHILLRPESGLSWWGIGLMFVLLVIAYVIDFTSGAVGAKWFGASKWGVAGVLIGGIVGLFFALPGLILGPIIGGLAFEMLFAKKELRPAVKSTWGSVLGTGVGLVARVGVSLVMVAVFLVDVFWW